MKQPIRYFSIGLLTASLIILLVVSLFDKQDGHVSEGSVDEMIATLKDEGYHVLSSSEYISLSVNTEPNENLDADEDNAEDPKKDEDEDEVVDETEETEEPEDTDAEVEEEEEVEEVHKYTLTIEPNMLGPTISELLEDNKIIADAEEFNRYLETEGYAPYLQLGDHKLSSDMSHYEIAEVIAKSR